MAAIVLITVVLVGFYSMATEARVKDTMGASVCDYQKTPEDCAKFGQCLTEAGYTVEDPCDDDDIYAANINETSWPQITICNWKKRVSINEDGTCDRETQKEFIESRMTFDNPQVKAEYSAAFDKCHEDNPDDCIAALLCVTKQSWKICYPNAKFHKEDKPED